MNGIPPFNVLSTPVSMSIQGTKNLTNMDYSVIFLPDCVILIPSELQYSASILLLIAIRL